MNGFGDFQTPPALAHAVLAACRDRGFEPARILEPTCGSGSFLRAAAAAFPHAIELIGIEYQRDRYAPALAQLERGEPRLSIHFADAYRLNFAALPWQSSGPLLVVGNPPWVTAAALGRLAGPVVQPPRSNVSGLRGLAARTGAANFDVAEFLLLKLLRELCAPHLLLALLVKESVARNIVAAAARSELGLASAEIVRFDARAAFGVAVDACCLLLSASPGSGVLSAVSVRAGFGASPATTALSLPPAVPARKPLIFRQGIKHDAADVFELRQDATGWRNGYGARVDIEVQHIYPLRKARALHSGRIEPTALIVPQQRLAEPTDRLETDAPALWRYLNSHAQRIAARKSSIYRNAPRFALFGIGAYSFAPWKVAVAGLYAQPRFRLIGPQAGRPVVLGDTAYFIPFERHDDAAAFMTLCGSAALVNELAARIVPGKRPVTKALLDGIDWGAIAAKLDRVPDRVHALLGETTSA